MKIKHLIIFSFLFGYTSLLQAQQKELDSLLKLNTSYNKEDTVKLNILNAIAANFSGISSDSALQYSKKEVALAQKISNKKFLADAYQSEGVAFSNNGDFSNALQSEQSALIIYKSEGNKKMMASCLLQMGVDMLFRIKDYSAAIKYLQDGLVIEQNLKNKANEALFMRMIALNYADLSDKNKALSYAQNALLLYRSLNDNNAVPECLNIIGGIYHHFHDYSQALEYFKKSFSEYSALNDHAGMAQELSNISSVYIDSSNYTKALEYEKKAMALGKSAGFNVSGNYTDLAAIYIKQKNYRQAINYARKSSITNKIRGRYDDERDALQYLSQAYAGMKQYSKAYIYYQRYIIARDSIDNTEKQKKITQLQMQYDFSKVQDSIKLEESLKDEKVKQQQMLAKLKLQQQWFYTIGIIIVCDLIAFYFYRRAKRKQKNLKTELAKEKAEQEKKEVEFQRSLADISMSALRSQMNPHFIFNCLNSIKLYTTQNNTAAASEYLTKFSRLIRMALENSRNESITLTAELEALELYIQMEGMRFKDKLAYTINVDKNVDADYIEIPPLLLQPYVENAIWHGLMQKEEGGNIDIHVAMSEEKSMLFIKIKDDGVGRAIAAERQSKTATKHKSYGMKVTSERLHLINQIYKTGASVIIDDLKDNNGDATGTLITIQIPV